MRWCCRSPARTARASTRSGRRRQAVGAALDRQRFEGEAASASEQFIDDNGTVRRLLVVGTGTGGDAARERREARRSGGGAAADLGRKDAR